MSTTFAPTAIASVPAERAARETFLQRLWSVLERVGHRRAARQLLLLDESTLKRAGLTRAELEACLR